MSSTRIVGAVASIVVLATVIRLILRRRLRVAYAGLWLVMAGALTVTALIPGLLGAVSSALGFKVPANFLFFFGVVLLLLVGIHLSVAVTDLEDRVQRLAEEVALINERNRQPSGSDPS